MVSPEVYLGVGIVILGLALAYGIVRAGRLRRSEREQIDQNVLEVRKREESAERNAETPNFSWNQPAPKPKLGLSYPIIVPIVLIGLVVGWMTWFAHRTGTGTQQNATIGSGIHRQTKQPVAAPKAPASDAASDSWRGSQGPANKSE